MVMKSGCLSSLYSTLSGSFQRVGSPTLRRSAFGFNATNKPSFRSLVTTSSPGLRRSRGNGSKLGGWLWFVPITTAFLGVWQVQRLFWKQNVLAQTEAYSGADPVDLLSTESIIEAKDSSGFPEFTKVHATGHFVYEEEMLVGPRGRNDQPYEGGMSGGGVAATGHLVFTPFVLHDEAGNPTSRKILVNRGWIPPSLKAHSRSRRAGDHADTPVHIEGVVRRGEQPRFTFLLPTNLPQKGEWYWIDLKSMAQHTGSSPFLVEMIAGKSIFLRLPRVNVLVQSDQSFHFSNNRFFHQCYMDKG